MGASLRGAVRVRIRRQIPAECEREFRSTGECRAFKKEEGKNVDADRPVTTSGCPHRTDGRTCLSCAGPRGGSKMKRWIRSDEYNAGYTTATKTEPYLVDEKSYELAEHFLQHDDEIDL